MPLRRAAGHAAVARFGALNHVTVHFSTGCSFAEPVRRRQGACHAAGSGDASKTSTEPAHAATLTPVCSSLFAACKYLFSHSMPSTDERVQNRSPRSYEAASVRARASSADA